MFKSIVIAFFLLLSANSSLFAQAEITFNDGGTLVIDRIEELLSKASIKKIKEAAKKDSTKTLTMITSYLKNKGLYMVPLSYKGWIDDQYDNIKLNCRMLILYPEMVEMKYDSTDEIGDVYRETMQVKSLNEYEIDRLMVACRKKN